MNKFLVLCVGSAAFLSVGAASAQTVSGGDAYSQGFAAGAATQQQNSFSAFQSGVEVGSGQSAAPAASLSQQSQFQADATATNTYNEGYHARAVEENDVANKAFNNGFLAGASEQRRLDKEFN